MKQVCEVCGCEAPNHDVVHHYANIGEPISEGFFSPAELDGRVKSIDDLDFSLSQSVLTPENTH